MSGQHGTLGRDLTDAEMEVYVTALRRLKALHREADAITEEILAYTESLTRRAHLRLVA